MLHSDQSHTALRSAHQEQHGLCATCEEVYGWWQGVNITSDEQAQWVCAGCAAACRAVPPPAGVMSLRVHSSLLNELGLNDHKEGPATLCRLAPAMPYVLAWAMEMDRVSGKALMEAQDLIPKSLESEWREQRIRNSSMIRFLFPAPAWWTGHFRPEPWLYSESDQQDLFGGVIARVSEDEELYETWCRCFSVSNSGNADGWVGKLPDAHPARTAGKEWIFVLPWYLIKAHALNQKRATHGLLLTRALCEQVEAGFKAAIQALVIPPEEPVRGLWESAGLTGAFRG